uniref:Uncharacterized protein n=1 Tax=Timema genevievae TaxID=629358 RepID=A0A7R9JX40_TIMGE|nr:unnamed protein product [Timema genevievae]
MPWGPGKITVNALFELGGILYEWLEHLKTPILYEDVICKIIIYGSRPEECVQKLDQRLINLVCQRSKVVDCGYLSGVVLFPKAASSFRMTFGRRFIVEKRKLQNKEGELSSNVCFNLNFEVDPSSSSSKGPWTVGSCSLEGPWMVGSCSLDGPWMVGSCSLDGPWMVGSGTVSSCSLEGSGTKEKRQVNELEK